MGTLLFGVGLALMVAPLTTGLMSSVPTRNAGIASAINNALSRVGQPLVAATVFIIVSGAFYANLASAVPGTDPASPQLRADRLLFGGHVPTAWLQERLIEFNRAGHTSKHTKTTVLKRREPARMAGSRWYGLGS